jgi:nitrous oxidase accessory protein NosD
MSVRPLAAVPLLVLAALSAPNPVRAETLDCTEIVSLPAVITSPGVYCLRKDLSTSLAGAAVKILAHDVTLDCNGYKIGGLAAGDTADNHAIASPSDRAVIRNCNLRGFRTGLYLTGAGNLVEHNRIEAMRDTAVYVFGGNAGSGSLVRHNRIYDTGLHYTDGTATAILASGPHHIVDNTIDTVLGADGTDTHVKGIVVQGVAAGGVIAGNRIRGLAEDGAGFSYGIYVAAGNPVSIRGNTIAAVAANYGIKCDGDPGVDSAVAASNHVLGGFVVPTENCTDGGGNLTP